MPPDLQALRRRIDTLNVHIVQLLDQRAALALQIGKAKQGGPVYDPAREQVILESVVKHSQGPLPPEAIQAIFKEIIASCRSLQQPKQIAYLGPEGTYSEEAARQYAGHSSTYMPYDTIDQAAQAIVSGEADLAIIPIENSTEGPVNRTLDLLLELPVTICGETILPIRHQLLSNAADLTAVKEVIAHPQALAQCRQWLDEHLPHAVRRSTSSNAQAARLASKDPALAAIAGVRAGKLYNLPRLAANIHDNRTNTTRFLALAATPAAPTGTDKTSLVCSVPNKPGALHHALSILANNNLNMTKLESRPSPNTLWDYVFYIDVDGHQEDASVQQAISQLRHYAAFVKIIGSYPRATS